MLATATMLNKLLHINVIAYVGLIIINVLAIRIPFFGKTPGDVSDLFPNLLTPADFSFKIWSLVYSILGFFAFSQAKLLFQKNVVLPTEVSAIGLLFLFSCILNFSWLIAWQSLNIGWAFVFIFMLWMVLILIYYKLAQLEKPKWFYTVPFSIYLAWVCIAALANLNVLLIESEFDFFGLTEEYWTASLIGLGICGTLLVLYLNEDIWFTIVLIWAFFGIYIKNKRLSIDDNWIIYMSLFAIIILSVIAVLVGLKNWNNKNKRI